MAPPGDNGGGLERGDLIRPIGAVLKFIHCDHADDVTGPKFEASFEVSTANAKVPFRPDVGSRLSVYTARLGYSCLDLIRVVSCFFLKSSGLR